MKRRDVMKYKININQVSLRLRRHEKSSHSRAPRTGLFIPYSLEAISKNDRRIENRGECVIEGGKKLHGISKHCGVVSFFLFLLAIRG